MPSPKVIFRIYELGSLLLFTFVGKIKLSKMKVAITVYNFARIYKF